MLWGWLTSFSFFSLLFLSSVFPRFSAVRILSSNACCSEVPTEILQTQLVTEVGSLDLYNTIRIFLVLATSLDFCFYRSFDCSLAGQRADF